MCKFTCTKCHERVPEVSRASNGFNECAPCAGVALHEVDVFHFERTLKIKVPAELERWDYVQVSGWHGHCLVQGCDWKVEGRKMRDIAGAVDFHEMVPLLENQTLVQAEIILVEENVDYEPTRLAALFRSPDHAAAKEYGNTNCGGAGVDSVSVTSFAIEKFRG